MARVAWINPTSGISGDMCLAAMVDLGADPLQIVEALETIEALSGFSLEFHNVKRGGLRALLAQVKLAETSEHRGLGEINSIIDESGLTQSQKELSKEIFFNLAQAEAKVHGVAPERVELHEVGSLDSILDICGFAIAKELLGLDQVYVSPPALGRGVTSGSHGVLSVPAPAVLQLLVGKEAYGGSSEFELTTPTGAAIIATAAIPCEEMPRMTISGVGCGAGVKDPVDYPNVVQMVIGSLDFEEQEAPELPGHFEQILELTTNLDDISGELSGYLISALISRGAIDAFLTPALVKKDRPGVVLTVVIRPSDVVRISTEIFSLTGTLGIRSIAKQRYVLDREFFEINLLGEKVSVKAGPYRSKVEFSHLASLSEKYNIPILQLEAMAQVEIEKLMGAG